MKENYFNPNPRRYPTRHDVVKVVEKWGDETCPDYSLVGIRNTSASNFQVGFKNPATGEVLQVNLSIYPNQHKDFPGWHVRDPRIWRLGMVDPRHSFEVYSPGFETLMMAYPDHRIVHLDNEDDEWPVFGWAVIGASRFIAFIQNPRDEDRDDDEPEYWKNPDLPYQEVVDDASIMRRVTDDMWEHTMRNIEGGYVGEY